MQESNSDSTAPLLKLLLDEDTERRTLVHKLGQEHDVTTVTDLGLRGHDDEVIYTVACQEDRVLVSHNHTDIEDAYPDGSEHPGLFLIFQDKEGLTDEQVAQAIRNIRLADHPIASTVTVLNPWAHYDLAQDDPSA